MRRILTPERADWKATANRMGFKFHTIEGERYWDETACYAFTLAQIDNDIEAPTNEIHAMTRALVDEVVGKEELLEKLAIPRAYWDLIARSWKEKQPHLYGRMDFSYDGTGPAKLLELNYDTPTSLFEASVFQWVWLKEQIERDVLPEDTDQYNSLHESLVLAFSTLALEKRLNGPLYMAAVRDAIEDQATVDYLQECAVQAGLTTRRLALEDIGVSADGYFTALNDGVNSTDEVIQTLFKLYPLEAMFTEEGGPALLSSGIQLIEPVWKAILSNKGVLPLLWERHEGHPNLLPAYFETRGETSNLPPGWVSKPLFSREGANVQMHLADGSEVESDGPYDDAPFIRQACHPLPSYDGGFPLVGSWVVGDRACGMGIREDATLITRDTSRFLPHIILD